MLQIFCFNKYKQTQGPHALHRINIRPDLINNPKHRQRSQSSPILCHEVNGE